MSRRIATTGSQRAVPKRLEWVLRVGAQKVQSTGMYSASQKERRIKELENERVGVRILQTKREQEMRGGDNTRWLSEEEYAADEEMQRLITRMREIYAELDELKPKKDLPLFDGSAPCLERQINCEPRPPPPPPESEETVALS